MSQTKRMSAVEAVVSTAVGLAVSLLAIQLICWAYDIPMSWTSNAIITFWMTVVSVLRSYVLRRAFNGGFKASLVRALIWYGENGRGSKKFYRED